MNLTNIKEHLKNLLDLDKLASKNSNYYKIHNKI